MNSIENVKIALDSIKDNFLRSLLTLLIIAVGIACLVGMLTAIDSLLFSMSDNFNKLGANSFSFRPSSETIKSNNGGRQRKQGDPIVFDDAKEFKEAAEKHNLQATWFAAMSNDFKYFYITPIEKFAELDENPMADMAKAMGDKFGDIFNRFDACYDSHHSYVIHLVEDLSYMPEGISQTQEGQDHRKWFHIYFKPENAKKIREGMKAVKDMYSEKGSKVSYRIYRNGFGTTEDFYIVAVSSKDEIDSATKGEENKKTLGPDRWETFSKVFNYAERYEEYSGEMRPDLSYSPKAE